MVKVNKIHLMAFLFFLSLICSCGSKDYSKEEHYLMEDCHIIDTAKVFTIVKAEKMRLYNPKLDDDMKQMILFGKTTYKKYIDALQSYSNGDITENDVFKTMKEVFTSIEPNSDGTIVMMKIRNHEKYFFEVMYSNNGVYYATNRETGEWLSREVYKQAVLEAREKLIDGLKGL